MTKASAAPAAVRRPSATVAMPSVAVAGLWQEFAAEDPVYADFCRAAVGRVVAHAAAPTGQDEQVAADPLLRTLALAREDEPGAPAGLPLLFRVDAAVGVLNGRRYLGDCGGGPQCYPMPGSTCLRHCAVLRAPRRRGHDPRADQPGSPPPWRSSDLPVNPFDGSRG